MGLLSEIFTTIRDKRRERKQARKLFLIALAFNKEHTYRWPRQEWMCPDCNSIHKSYETSIWTGLQFPKCCKHPAGHRHYKEAATGW